MSTLAPEAAPAPAASVTSRLVPALVDGQLIHIECASWCTLDHVAEAQKHLVDVYHFGKFVDLEMPRFGNSPALLAFARLGADVFSPDPQLRQPYLYVEDGGGGEDGYMRAAEAEAFADNLIAFAEKVRALARSIA